MTTQKAPLARFVQPAIDDARLERQFGAIQAGLETHRPSRPLWITLAFATVALVLLVGVGLRARGKASTESVARFETGASAGEVLTLGDGSRLVLDAQTTLALAEITPERMRIALSNGGVDCDVSKNPKRSFVVEASGYAVRVVGTRFTVRFSDSSSERRLVVTVDRGTVEVSRENESRMLNAGETWSAVIGPSPLALVENTPAPAPVESAAAPEPTPEPAVSAEPAPGTGKTESAKQLFERATRARAAGRSSEARQALTQLRTRYPDDPRASLAAFELARIEQDEGRDPKAAAKLLDEAVEKAPAGSSLREDAEARRIDALNSSGDIAGCKKAQSAFLARYTQSVHRARVQRACEKP